jgi:predicted acetyltransferase
VLELVSPDAALHAAWLESHREWGSGQHEDGFGVGPADDVETPQGFATWVDELLSRPAHVWWIVDDHRVVGGITLRAFTNDSVQRLGHVGYGVQPSARGRGIAAWALGQVVEVAWTTGMQQVLLVCSDSNVASIRTIERCGGVLEEAVQDAHGRERRYWIVRRTP